MRNRQSPAIRSFILEQLDRHPDNITALAVRKFGISRTAINKYLQRLVEEGWITAEGNTKGRRYRLRKISDIAFNIALSEGLSESAIWQHRILPHIKNAPKNILDICYYGFTEILNNAIDHSASLDALVSFEQTFSDIEIIIIDRGVGIFEKIRRHFDLGDPRSALLELSKGKLTSSPKKHAGEGIFFTSRMFNEFTIRSGELAYIKERQIDDDWLIEIRDQNRYRQGTAIRMTISMQADWTTRNVFAAFQGKEIGFRKTHVPLTLARYKNEELVSRSQAKRVLARFDKFSEVMLDFNDVETIGQAFADEIFRVFKHTHPDIDIVAINTTDDVRRMIDHVTAE